MPAKRDVHVRFWEKVQQREDGCWEWTAGKSVHGYGRFAPVHGFPTMAYRWSYEQMVGPIPKGLDLDHLCFFRACVNPYHLDPVPRGVNASRTRGRRRRDQCDRGHDMPLGLPGQAQGACWACRNSWEAEYRRKNRARIQANLDRFKAKKAMADLL